MKSGFYLRRLQLLPANSSLALRKDSEVENSNRKELRLQRTGRRVTSQKTLKNSNEGFYFTQEKIRGNFFVLNTGLTIHKKHTRR